MPEFFGRHGERADHINQNGPVSAGKVLSAGRIACTLEKKFCVRSSVDSLRRDVRSAGSEVSLFPERFNDCGICLAVTAVCVGEPRNPPFPLSHIHTVSCGIDDSCPIRGLKSVWFWLANEYASDKWAFLPFMFLLRAITDER